MQNMNYECKKKNRFSPYIPIRGGFSLLNVHVSYTLMHSSLIKYKSASESHPKKLILHESKKHVNMKGVKGAETKTLLREAAFKLFLTYDYNTVSLKQIEQIVKVSRGCLSYHYFSKQEIFVDVIDYYVLHKQESKNKEVLNDISLWDFINGYIQRVQVLKEEMSRFLLPETDTNITRAYMNLILQAERYYAEFNDYMDQITLNELRRWEFVITRAKERGEIKSTCNVPLLAGLFRNLFIGKSYQDALTCGLKIEEMRDLFYYQYKLIKT